MAYRPVNNQQVFYDNESSTPLLSESMAKVKSWLSSVYMSPTAHKVNIHLGALLNGTNAVTGVHRFGNIGSFLQSAIAVVGLPSNAISSLLQISSISSEMNAILDELKNPNIGGIPIHAESESESQDGDVQQQLLIKASEQGGGKSYNTDNVVLKPKTWQLKGYLMATKGALDTSLIIKPSLLLQRKMLQLYMESRMPVVFKTHDNRYFTALISHMDTSYVVQALNALQINLTLTEFNALSVESEDISLNHINATLEE